MRPSVDGHMWVGDVLASTTHRGLVLTPRMSAVGQSRYLVVRRRIFDCGLQWQPGEDYRYYATTTISDGSEDATEVSGKLGRIDCTDVQVKLGARAVQREARSMYS